MKMTRIMIHFQFLLSWNCLPDYTNIYYYVFTPADIVIYFSVCQHLSKK